MRKLVTIRTISELQPIDGADLIEVAVVDGWAAVVKKGEFQSGDQCVYFEVDSALKDGDPRWQFLVDKSSRNYNGNKVHVLRTIKLRGKLSQGLVLKLTDFPELMNQPNEIDLAQLIGVEKYEKPVPAELAGQVRGNFPSFLKRTDQERCQNIISDIFVENRYSEYEVSMKLDGTSFTCFYVDGEFGLCSRNLELKLNEENKDNSYVKMYVNSGLQNALKELGLNYAIQGELMGEGIQGNREKLLKHKLFVFDIYDIDGSCYLAPEARHRVMTILYNYGLNADMVAHVPVLHTNVTVADLKIYNVAELLNFAEGPSITHAVREGLVFKRMDGKFSFKAISNQFLLKEKE